ncbi:MAG: DedA family protein [Mycobacteriales bacterium]
MTTLATGLAATTAGPRLLDPQYLIDTFGLIGLLIIIFAECGLLIGFFLPGDTLLFSAGVLISKGIFDIPLWAALVLTPLAAILGNVCGYGIGARAGPAIFDRPDSRLFKREHVDRAAAFFERHGPLTIVLARFVPAVRTFVTVVAGASRMRFATFAAYSIISGVLWCVGVMVAGYYLGRVDIIASHVEVILLLGVASTLCAGAVPLAIRYLKKRRSRDEARVRAARDLVG